MNMVKVIQLFKAEYSYIVLGWLDVLAIDSSSLIVIFAPYRL